MVGSIASWFRKRRRAVLLVAAFVVVGAGVGIAIGYTLREQRKTDQLRTDGEQALTARDYSRARDLLMQYLKQRPTDAHRAAARGPRRPARCAAYGDAREQLKRCRAEGGDDESLTVEEALLDVETGDYQPIAFLRERAKRDDDLALVILEVLIQRDLDTYQLGTALDEFTRYLARRPDDLHARLGRGFVWERFLSFADAVEELPQGGRGAPG